MRLPTDPSARAMPVDAKLRRAILVRMGQLLLQQAITGALLFAAAGTWRWWRGWLYLGIGFALLAAVTAYVLPRNPEIIAERGKLHKGTARFDKLLIAVYAATVAAIIVVAGLDAVRFGWAPLGPAWILPGALLTALGMLPAAGAMAVNRHLEPTVRIQQERGHQVVTTGPYRYVRHPMYLGLLLQVAGIPMLLGSAWSAACALATALSVIVRTALEDRTLQRDLPGYAEYARRTRFRLVPGIW